MQPICLSLYYIALLHSFLEYYLLHVNYFGDKNHLTGLLQKLKYLPEVGICC